MNRALLSKAVLLLGLLLLLTVPSTQAAEPRTSANPVCGIPSGLATWDVVTQVWDLLTGIWAENGCRLDPNGRCLPSQDATVEADNGCRIDPNGRCVS